MSHKKTHDIRVEGFHIDVSDGTAGERPHFGFMLECRSDLQNKTKEPAVLFWNDFKLQQCPFLITTHSLYKEPGVKLINAFVGSYLRVKETVKQEDKEPLK